MLLTDKYADKIYGTITCYDRMIIQGYIPGWSHAEGMTGYLNANNIRIFDFSNFSQPLTEQIRANAQRIADENGIEIEFIRKLRAFRKDDRIQQIIQETGKKKSIYSLYQLFTIMKAADYRYLEFISSFDDHSGGKENLTKVTDSVVDKGRSYRGLNFFAERDLHVLEVISRGGYMTFGMQGKDIRQHFENISPSAMSRIFKRLRLHGIIERVQGSYKYFATAYGKEIIAAGLTVKNLVLIPALA